MYTINNYGDDQEPLQWLPVDSFSIWQAEVGASGTPHLQGYVELNKVARLSYMRSLESRAHWEIRRGSQQDACNYCSKEETRVSGPFTHGELKKQGQRMDLIAMRECLQKGGSIEDLKDMNFNSYCHAKRALDCEYELIRNQRQKVSVLSLYESVQWRPWQRDVIELIQTDPDPRRVHWFYDEAGNTGKSYLATYVLAKYESYLCTGGKVADIQYSYRREPIVLLDLSRTKAECMDHLYEMIERWKDGSFLSIKYETQLKMFDSPHVLVFSNFRPDISKLSIDRWDICYIRRNRLEREQVMIDARHDIVKYLK